jgi:serine/threonine-protein kinase
MPLTPGQKLGPYEVTALIGGGGMGEVYRARDTRLGRDVAIKVARAALDPRFEREARTVAALSHANIGAVYDVGPDYIVMELVEGPTLEELIAGDGRPGSESHPAALSVDRVLEIARQIALALEAAHQAGVVHRDLKPANIKVRPDGAVKVLDFGLASNRPRDLKPGGDWSASGAPTLTADATAAGTILGTAAYMSPEQATGRPADARSDIWSFGCVLYEMLTGRRAFGASSLAETLSAVLTAEVDWSVLPEGVPPAVRAFLIRCLERDPRQRVHAIADVRLALSGAFDTVDAGAPGLAGRIGRRFALAAVATALLATAALTWMLAARYAGETAAPVVSRLQMTLPADQEFYYNGRHVVAVSPAGTHVAYTAGLGLWLHAIDSLEAVPVPGAELEARSPFFSPDGTSIGYFAAGELRRVSTSGGAPVTIARIVNPWGARWDTDGMIYYGQGADGIWRVPEAGGTPDRLVAVGEGEMAHGPQLLPGGRWMLYTLLPQGVGSWNRAQIVAQALDSDERVVLVDGGRDARYLPTGHLLFALSGELFVAPFDPTAPRLTGSAMPVISGVFDAGTVTGAVHFDVSTSGTLVYVPVVGAALRLVWVNRSGNEELIPADARPYRHARVSPDGSRIAVEIEEPGNVDIWVGDVRRGSFTRLPGSPDVESDPIWAPDGSRVVFTSVYGKSGIFSQAADGSGAAAHVVDGSGGVRALTWTLDGRLVYEELAGAQIRVVPLDGSASPEAMDVINDPVYFNEMLPALSPDGQWLAYQSTESGTMEVYVRPFPALSSGRLRISSGTGWAPLWSRDGREIYYRTTTRLMAVRVQASPEFRADPPQPLFGLGDYALAGTRGVKYDVAPDGRFLLTKDERGGTGAYESIVVVQHWFEELRRAGR